MHKLIIPLLALSLAFLGACGGDHSTRGRSKTGGLNATDYDRLLKINRMQQDNIDARDVAHPSVPALSEKAEAMREKMASPKCVNKGEIPKNELTGDRHEQTITGPSSTCPISWHRIRYFNLADKTMEMVDDLVIHDEQYRNELSRMSVRSMGGKYTVIPTLRGHRVLGAITIENFQTIDYGGITGRIAVDATKEGDKGGGSVVLSLKGNRWGAAASINWNIQRGVREEPVYRVNNVKVDKNQFDTLFSAYELDKYMDNAINMK